LTETGVHPGPRKSYGIPLQQHGRAVALRIGAVTMFGAMMAALKYATFHGVSPVEILFYRNIFALPTIIIWVLMSGGFAIVRTQRPMAHVTRSAIGLVVMTCTFVALSMLPLAEATVISFSAPLFATILSALVLGEKVMWHRWTAIAVGFFGVLMVVRPGGSALPAIGVTIGLAAALGTAIVVITLRQIGTTESAAAIVFWFTIAGVVVTALPMPFFVQQHLPHVWIAVVLGGVLGGIGQIMLTAAVRYAPVSVLAPFDYLQLVWATLWGFVLFNVIPTTPVLVGGALIAVTGCYVVWRERKAKCPIVPEVELRPSSRSAFVLVPCPDSEKS
jgi:drug/metabolite transporter (DMT)-like permease